MTKKRIYTFGDNKVIYYKAYVSPYEEDETRKIKDEYIKPQGKFYNPEEAFLLGNIERNKYKPKAIKRASGFAKSFNITSIISLKNFFKFFSINSIKYFIKHFIS